MTAPLTLDDLRTAVASGEIDSVLACPVDMQGRLMGKRFNAVWFLEHVPEETHSGNYDHYVHAARREQTLRDSCVSDWERQRGFERS